MKIVQRHRGWVSDEAIRDIAGFLGMSRAELDGVATFYNLIFRKPVGRHVIYLRQRELLDHRLRPAARVPGAKARHRPRPDYGRQPLHPHPNPCLGCCDRAPAMMVDDDLHVDLTPEKIDRILEGYK